MNTDFDSADEELKQFALQYVQEIITTAKEQTEIIPNGKDISFTAYTELRQTSSSKP